MDEQEDKKKKKKKKLIIIIICIIVAVLGSIGAAVPFVFSSSKSTTKSVVEVYVSAYKVSTHGEVRVSKEKVEFEEEDLDVAKSTSAINQSIDEEHYLKLVFMVKQKLNIETTYTIDFQDTTRQNCIVTYKIGTEGENPLLDDKIVSTSSEDFIIEVYIKVDNVLLDSELTGKLVLKISNV